MARMLDDLTLQLGVKNIFDRAPPLDAGMTSSYMWLSPFADIRLRSYWISARVAF